MHPRSADERSASIGQDALAYADTLFNLARYLAGNSADAEDLVQETYARAMRSAAQFEPGTNLKAWLFRILRNTWLSLARRRRIDPTVGGLATDGASTPSPCSSWAASTTSPGRARPSADDEHARLQREAMAGGRARLRARLRRGRRGASAARRPPRRLTP
jgi:RNA polymerase sigma factor (sigma-70 family)